MQTLQGLLAWSILYERDPALPYSQDQFKRRSKRIPPRAFEFFVKGLQSAEQKSREIFLKRAIKEYNEAESVGHYALAIYELGLVQYRQKNSFEAAKKFRRLIDDLAAEETRLLLDRSAASQDAARATLLATLART